MSPSQAHNLAQKVEDLELCQSDLQDTNLALSSCWIDMKYTEPSFWQEPAFIVGGFAVTFALGSVFGLTKCFGLCKY